MRTMRDSQIEWVGQIPVNWRTIRTKYVVSIINGSDPKTEGETPVYGSGGSSFKTCGEYKEGPTVLLGRKGTVDVPQFVDGRYWNVDTAFDTRIKNSAFSIEYFYRLAQCFDYKYYTMTTTLPSMTQTNYGEIVLPFPSLTEQDSICRYLQKQTATVDALIAAKEKTNTLLKERRQSLIYEAVTKGLDPTAPMKDSGIKWIGTIPENWKTCRIKHLVDTSHPYPVGDGDHGMIKADDYQTEGIPYIRVLNLSWGTGLNLDDLVYISEELNDRIKNSELRPNDILIAKTGATIGKTAIVPDSLPLSNTTSHVGKITISPAYDAKYFFYVMTSFVVQKQIIDLSSMQSTRPELGIDGLKNLIVTFPPMDEQQRISNYLDRQCDAIDSMIRSTDEIISSLKEYRQSMIYEAVTGKIEVGNV